jgi:hypothetical protein
MMVLMRIAFWAFAARVFSVCAALTVALLVAPEVFGLYGRMQMLGLVFMVFAFLRLERAVVSAPRLKEAFRASKMGLMMMPFFAMISVGVSAVLIAELAPFQADSQLRQLPPAGISQHRIVLSLFFLSLIGRALILLVHSWQSRWGLQASISQLIFLQAMTQMAVQLLLIATGIQPIFALILGEIAGSGVATVFALRRGNRIVIAILNAQNASHVLKSQWQLPLFNLPAGLMSQILVALPLIAFGRLSDAAMTGHLALAWRISEAPMQMLAATATSLAVTTGIWVRHDILKDDKKKALAYVTIVVVLALLLICLAQIIGALNFPGRLQKTAQYMPIAALITAAVALGGPHADLVTFAGAEKAALLIHGLAASAALLLCFITNEAHALLLGLAVITLIRSAALWVLLPLALGRREAGRR